MPDWLITRWNREVTNTLESTNAYPKFSPFVDFIVKEAKIACNPVSSHFALNDERKNRDTRSSKPNVKTLATNVKPSTHFTTENSTATKVPLCHYCNKTGHLISTCDAFNKMTIERKRSFIKEKRLCFGCMKRGHLNSECRRKLSCTVCKGRHPTCMHEERQSSSEKDEKVYHEANVASVTSFKVNRNANKTVSSKSMIVPVWVSSETNPSCEILTYALLDTQSDTTFIHEDTATALHVQGQPIKLSLSTMTAQQTVIESKRITGLKVRGFNSTEKLIINCAYTRGFIPVDRSHIPTNENAKQWHHLNEIANEIPPLQSCDVGLLVGYNCPSALAPTKIVTGEGNEPYAIKTSLGWSIVGYVSNPIEGDNLSSFCNRISVKELPICTPKDMVKVLESDFKDINSERKFSQDDLQFLKIQEQNIHQREDKHYEMPLPFKSRPTLPDNRRLANIRLDHLKRKLQSNDKYFTQYKTFMEETISRGDAELVQAEAVKGSKWYIPHHGVYHPKKPDKLRIVFDCSARYGGTFLNEHLLTGPDLTNGLAGVLCRFRRYPIAIMCDIEKMFHQFNVNEEDRDFLRFLWWEDSDITKQLLEYRMNVHLFGAASSPGCANYGLKHLAKSHENILPNAAFFIQNDFYVDDGLTSVETENEAINLIRDAQSLCSKGGLRLHKFTSNSSTVMDSIEASERSDNITKLDLALDDLPMERALGVKWSVEDDNFNFSVKIKNTKPTRRNMLSIVASIFDPLGFLSPLVLNGKRILQEMCRVGVGWDDPLPVSKEPEWDNWIGDLANLNQVKIPRCILPSHFGKPIHIELHHFSDASTSGYGQCSYIRYVGENAVHCSFLMGKARVAPTKLVTIPRLELTAAVLSVNMSLFLREEINLPISNEFFWTDSRVVLSYIKNEARRFHVFVANRVEKIRESSNVEQWYYIESSNNPADYALRGLSANEISTSSWLTGPTFLWEMELPITNVETELKIGDPEVRTCRSLCSKTTVAIDILERFDRFSNWRTAVSVTARIIRLANGIKGTHFPTVEERRNAELTLIKHVQRKSFSEEINILRSSTSLPKTNKLYQLEPALQDNVVRVGGRLENSQIDSSTKHPIILPRDNHLTKLIISSVHERVCHQGRGITMNQLRADGYWILGGSKTISNFIRKCVICRKLRRQTETQRMADLPKDRVEPSPPFTYVGMDCFGPFITKQNRKEVKRYGLLFTCLCSRAVHIEMLDDMSTDSFINGLRCFMAIRGIVRQIRCDQGSNFVGAKNEFEKELKSAKLNSFMAEKQCEFVMNAPYSSHTGGIWERQIRTVRNIMNAILTQHPGRLDDSCLRTFFYEAMAIVNSRPLTISEINDPKELEPLTPNHILTAKTGIPPPPPGEFVREDLYVRKRWRRVQFLLEQFWSRWKREYMMNLTLRQKWHTAQRNIRQGDIVLVKDEDLSRNKWPLAKVVEANPDTDGLVRRVRVMIGNKLSGKPSVLERSVHKLVLLVEQ